METAPEILTQQSANIQIVVWLGSLITLGLLVALRTLWVQFTEQRVYIRAQDKSNVLLLTELLNVAKISGVDVSKVYDAIIEKVLPKVVDNGNDISRLTDAINKA